MSDEITIRIRLADAAKFAGETRIARVEIDELGDAAARANRKSRDSAGGLNLLQKSMKFNGFNKADMVVGILGVLAPALSAASAGTVGLIGALAPLGGLLAALPGALLGAAQGLGVLKLATSGVGGALGGLNGELNPKKFAALSSPAQQFVLTLNSMKAPVKTLQQALQRGLFPGLTSGLKAASPALSVLRGPLEGTARVLGSFGSQLGHLVGSRGFLQDLASQASFNNVQLGRLGGGLLHVVDGLRQIGVASRPLISWLTGLATGWAATADKTLTADRANGKLATTFQTIQRVSSEFFKILGNTGRALFNVGNIGRKALGESILASLVKGSEALKRWTQSGPGVAKITKFFTEAKPALYAFAELLKAVVVDIFKLGQGGGGGLATLFGQLRTQVLPMLLVVTTNLAKLFFWVDKNLPGGAWLLTIGYLLTKLGGGGLIAAAATGLGKKFGTNVAAGLGAETGAFSKAGGSLGLVMGAALIGAVVLLAKSKLGHEIEEALGLRHKQKSPLDLAIADPKAITPQSLMAMSAGERNQLQKMARADKERHYPAATFWGTNHLKKVAEGERTKSQSAMQKVEQQYNHPHKKLWAGGLVTAPGIVEVGERGPELLSLPRSAMVTPLSPSLRAPTLTEVRSTGGRGGRDEQPIHVHSHTTITLRDKPIAEGTNEVVARSKALA
jgi:hypothetical protein